MKKTNKRIERLSGGRVALLEKVVKARGLLSEATDLYLNGKLPWITVEARRESLRRAQGNWGKAWRRDAEREMRR